MHNTTGSTSDAAKSSSTSSNDKAGPAVTPRSHSDSVTTAGDTKERKESQAESRKQFIHWCVDEAEGTTRLVDFDVKTVSKTTLIQQLREHYSSIRRWQNWWDLTECDGVRFIKFRRIFDDLDIIANGGYDFPAPSNREYEYIPYDTPDITRRYLEAEFRHYFRKIGKCTALGCPKILERIPKKVPDRLASQSGIDAYGMYAVHKLALWRWALLVILTQLGPWIFAAYWLSHHPWDLQNAFMPSGLVLASLAVFRPASSGEHELRSN